MTRIRAAVCHDFGAPLQVEEIEIRPPRGREVEVALVDGDVLLDSCL